MTLSLGPSLSVMTKTADSHTWTVADHVGH